MSIPWADEEGEIDRLMCWAHVDRAVDRPEYLAAVRAEHKEVANKIMDDLNTLQWTANDEMTLEEYLSFWRRNISQLTMLLLKLE